MECQSLSEIYESRELGMYAYRYLSALPGMKNVQSNWRWRLRLWDPEDRENFTKQMAEEWDIHQDNYPHYRSAEWSKFAPDTTIPFSVKEVEKMDSLKIDWRQYRSKSPVKPEKSVEEMKKWLKEPRVQ